MQNRCGVGDGLKGLEIAARLFRSRVLKDPT